MSTAVTPNAEIEYSDDGLFAPDDGRIFPDGGRATNSVETFFFVERGGQQRGIFKTAEEAIALARLIGGGNVRDFRGRLIDSKEVTKEEFETAVADLENNFNCY